MHWSSWDVVVTLAAVLQVAALAALIVNVARLGRNARAAARRAGTLAARASALAGAGVTLWQKNRQRVGVVVAQVSQTRAHVGRLTDRTHTAHLPVNWSRIFAAYATLRTVRGYAQYAQNWLAIVQKRPAPVAKPARPVKPPLAERIGLVPPLWLRVRQYTPYLRIVLEIRKELKRRGVL